MGLGGDRDEAATHFVRRSLCQELHSRSRQTPEPLPAPGPAHGWARPPPAPPRAPPRLAGFSPAPGRERPRLFLRRSSCGSSFSSQDGGKRSFQATPFCFRARQKLELKEKKGRRKKRRKKESDKPKFNLGSVPRRL